MWGSESTHRSPLSHCAVSVHTGGGGEGGGAGTGGSGGSGGDDGAMGEPHFGVPPLHVALLPIPRPFSTHLHGV